MSLTMGRAPFAPKEVGCFNFERTGPQQTLYWEDFPKRVRAEFGGEPAGQSFVRDRPDDGLLFAGITKLGTNFRNGRFPVVKRHKNPRHRNS